MNERYGLALIIVKAVFQLFFRLGKIGIVGSIITDFIKISLFTDIVNPRLLLSALF